MLPLTADEAQSLHPARLPANLYVADATLLPRSLGNPPILTILALARRVARAAMTANEAARRPEASPLAGSGWCRSLAAGGCLHDD